MYQKFALKPEGFLSAKDQKAAFPDPAWLWHIPSGSVTPLQVLAEPVRSFQILSDQVGPVQILSDLVGSCQILSDRVRSRLQKIAALDF